MFNNKKIERIKVDFEKQIEQLVNLIDKIHWRNVVAKDEIDALNERIKKLESTKKPKVKS